MTLQVSGMVIAATVMLLIICFILPLALYYFFYKFADGRGKVLLLGGVAFFVGGFVLESAAQHIVYMFTDMSTNIPVNLVYNLVFSPLLFVLINYLAMRLFGAEMKTTGDALTYSTGYTGLQNILMVGFTELLNLINVLSISGASNYVVVSDSDYVSYSNLVSASNLLSESNFKYIQSLCSRPVSYIILMCIDRLFIMAAYAALLLVIWLAVRKKGGTVLLAAALGMRIIIAIPSILGEIKVIENMWILMPMALTATAIVWVIAIFCRKKFIDCTDIVYIRKQK
ncbi:MAG: YhfC family glutamic-type intramembrane protease [Acutalibacteraceae bacterium]